MPHLPQDGAETEFILTRKIVEHFWISERTFFLFRKRDRAHREIKNIFFKVTQKRRQSGEKVDDILQTLIDATYK